LTFHTYCLRRLPSSSIGYGRRYNSFAAELKGEFGDNITVTGQSTPTATSKFEVTVDGRLIHSKIGGQGFVDSEQKLMGIFAQIEAAMK
jgi:selT/selW/selH-like putative selenoprotein